MAVECLVSRDIRICCRLVALSVSKTNSIKVTEGKVGPIIMTVIIIITQDTRFLFQRMSGAGMLTRTHGQDKDWRFKARARTTDWTFKARTKELNVQGLDFQDQDQGLQFCP